MQLAPNVFAIVDSERSAEGEALDTNHAEFAEVCMDLAIPCHILNRRATENYFADEAIERVFGPVCRALQPYESAKESGRHWNKHQNCRVVSRTRKEHIENTDLGDFLWTLAASVDS
jgi:hypothetical protein